MLHSRSPSIDSRPHTADGIARPRRVDLVWILTGSDCRIQTRLRRCERGLTFHPTTTLLPSVLMCSSSWCCCGLWWTEVGRQFAEKYHHRNSWACLSYEEIQKIITYEPTLKPSVTFLEPQGLYMLLDNRNMSVERKLDAIPTVSCTRTINSVCVRAFVYLFDVIFQLSILP